MANFQVYGSHKNWETLVISILVSLIRIECEELFEFGSGSTAICAYHLSIFFLPLLPFFERILSDPTRNCILCVFKLSITICICNLRHFM